MEKVNKTTIAVSLKTWEFLNKNRKLNETLEAVFLRLLKVKGALK